MTIGTREVRALGRLERRAEGDAPKLVGYAALFNTPATIADYFVEQIAPGAFAKAIGRDDVRALFNHDEDHVLGRTTAGTLELSEDATGLRVSITPPDTQFARDLLVSIERGDISQMSFGFRAIRAEWDYDTEPYPTRTLVELELLDVSVVTFPAYDDTSVAVRSLEAHRQVGAGLIATRMRMKHRQAFGRF
jgi:HK97 family phage prohead protease